MRVVADADGFSFIFRIYLDKLPATVTATAMFTFNYDGNISSHFQPLLTPIDHSENVRIPSYLQANIAEWSKNIMNPIFLKNIIEFIIISI